MIRIYGIIVFYHLNILASAAAPAADASKTYPKFDYLFSQGNLRALNVLKASKHKHEKIAQEIKDKSAHIVAAFKAAYIASKPKLRRARYYLFKKNGTIECYDDVLYEKGKFVCGLTAQASPNVAKQSAQTSPSITTKSKIASYNIA